MIDMNMDIQHLMEACDKSSGACSYNGKKKGNDANTNDPSSNEGCCKKEVCPTTNEGCKNEGCKRESSIFDGPFQALDEFKGDAELQYAVRSVHDTMSGDHKYSKLYNNNKKEVRDMISGRGSDNSVSNMKQKRETDKDKDAARKQIKTTGLDSRSKVSKELFKDESASIFDSLFSQI